MIPTLRSAWASPAPQWPLRPDGGSASLRQFIVLYETLGGDVVSWQGTGHSPAAMDAWEPSCRHGLAGWRQDEVSCGHSMPATGKRLWG